MAINTPQEILVSDVLNAGRIKINDNFSSIEAFVNSLETAQSLDANNLLGHINDNTNPHDTSVTNLVVPNGVINANRFVRVNSSGTALEFTSVSLTRVRGNVTHTTASLASLANEATTITLGRGFLLYSITTDVPARVRLYSTIAARDSDLTRPENVTPANDLQLIADVVTDISNLTIFLIPTVTGASYETTPLTAIPMTVTNKAASTGTVNVSINRVILED